MFNVLSKAFDMSCLVNSKIKKTQAFESLIFGVRSLYSNSEVHQSKLDLVFLAQFVSTLRTE